MAIQNISPTLLSSLSSANLNFANALTQLATQNAFSVLANRSPGNFVAAQRFRSDVGALGVIGNSIQTARSALRLSDGNLAGVGESLNDIRSLVLQANSGFADESTRAILQGAIDTSVRQIRRQLNPPSTSFGSAIANSSFQTTDDTASILSNVQFTQTPGPVGDGITIDVTVNSVGTQATQTLTNFGGGATFELTGNDGSVEINFSGGSAADFAAAINAQSTRTGVSATVNGADVDISSAEAGSSQFVNVSVVSGSALPAGFPSGTVRGTDASVTVEGLAATADGNAITFNANNLVGSFTVDSATAAGTSTSLDIVGGGVTLPIDSAGGLITIGVPAFSGNLGSSEVTGGIASLLSGGSLDLSSGNLSGQLSAIEGAQSEILAGRSQLGAIDNSLGSAGNSVSSLLSETQAAFADLSSVDFAAQVVNFTQARLQVEVITALISQSQSGQAGVLRLLSSDSDAA